MVKLDPAEEMEPGQAETAAGSETPGGERAPDGERTSNQPGRPSGTGAAGGEPTVRLERVSKHFGDLVAVRDLDLDIGSGEFFTLLGPSGCGKTTTLRMVAGFEQPTAGRVLIDGADVAGLPSYRRPTNTVFQSYALFPHLSVRDNVAFGLRRKKVAKNEIRQRVESELERVGLAAEVNRKPNQLSGGQQWGVGGGASRGKPKAKPARRWAAAAGGAAARPGQPAQGIAA